MSAGVVQLIAIGAQDKFIVGDPQISFSVQHSNAMLIFHNPLKNKQSTER